MVRFKPTRQETLELLSLMGVELPKKTKLMDDELDKRLTRVLDSCQYLSRVVPDPPLMPAAYTVWRTSSPDQAISRAVIRSNSDEASFIEKCRAQGIEDPIPMHTNAFSATSGSLQTIGGHVDQGYERYTFQDPGMTSDIRLRVVEVLKFDNVTPIFLVLYRHTL
ncbi:hypothetical protein C8J57DRAFT_1133115 [Mycena rebaudengoi]|nr:hypothetical protein C8J57DRAFT_1133115 [Mycena rebaudengoi]